MKAIFGLALLFTFVTLTVGTQKFVTYIDKIDAWWPAKAIAEGLGVPGYAKDNQYNVINLAFILANKAADIALIWESPLDYFGKTTCPFGKSNPQAQKTLKQLYNTGNIKIMISAFGATEFPTTQGKDPVKTCTDLANFVKDNDLDGIDLDWEDNAAMENGTGEQWLIDCTKAIRKILPVGEYLLSNAPQGPYFLGKPVYKNGGYVKIHEEVGHLIDWYNIQFYNQGNQSYDSYEKLFGDDSKTSVKSIMEKAGVPKEMIVVGKPVTQGDASNTGVVDPSDLGRWAAKAKSEFGWETGIMTWQYPSDVKGDYVKNYKSAFIRADVLQIFEEEEEDQVEKEEEQI